MTGRLTDRRWYHIVRRSAPVFIAVGGAIGVGAELVPSIPPVYWLSGLAIVGVVTVFVFLRLTRPSQLPADALPDPTPEHPAVLFAPADASQLRSASALAKRVFGHEAHTDLAAKWNERNPFVTAVMVSSTGHFLGYFDIVPIPERTALALRSGQLVEGELTPEHVLPAAQMAGAAELYLSGIAVKDGATEEETHERTCQLISGLALYAQHFYGTTRRTVLATAATEKGRRLLERSILQARVVCPADARQDGFDLYEIELTEQLIGQVLAHASKRAPPPTIQFGREPNFSS
jgi:hypothetical protein